jgi:hypothetical protein
MNEEKETKRHLVGLGFDRDDEMKRITRAGNFTLLGGSEETHERMVEEAQAFVEMLNRYGKKMEELTRKEYYEIVEKISRNSKTWFYLGGGK